MKDDIKYIEQWALLKIIDNYEIENSITTDRLWCVEKVSRDISVTFPACVFRTLPNYARLEVIKALEYNGVLSMDNIHYVESELRNIDEAYENYDWLFIVDKTREIKRSQRGSYV
ncbi:MAG: hypothetical protein RPR97_11685 [Colwellia sp.]|jgi:hypothetical protein